MIKRILVVMCCLLIASCATRFDRNNIQAGQRVYGPAVSIEVPTEGSWFAVDYGTGNHIRLAQINYDDSYLIRVALNRGPYGGMFKSAEAHLEALLGSRESRELEEGVIEHSHEERIANEYGKLCVSYSTVEEDWRGRNTAGPAMVDLIGLTCPHPYIQNALVNVEISHRYEIDGARVNLKQHAEALFNSIQYEGGQ